MTARDTALAAFLDHAAAGLRHLLRPGVARAALRLEEDEAGEFEVFVPQGEGWRPAGAVALSLEHPAGLKMIAGKAVDVVFHPRRFMFKTLSLPARAAEFLPGIIGSQIDRMSPWTAAQALFGWSVPQPDGAQIAVTVCATAREQIAPAIAAIEAARPRCLAVFAGGGIELQRRTGAERDSTRWRTGLAAGLGLFAAACLAAVAACWLMLAAADARLAEAQARIAALRASLPAATGKTQAANAALARHRARVPPVALTLETLARILPDHTHVADIEIEDARLRLSGLTADAPGLIGIIESSGRFGNATFHAPTTRRPPETREHFSIEAVALPDRGADR